MSTSICILPVPVFLWVDRCTAEVLVAGLHGAGRGDSVTRGQDARSHTFWPMPTLPSGSNAAMHGHMEELQTHVLILTRVQRRWVCRHCGS